MNLEINRKFLWGFPKVTQMIIGKETQITNASVTIDPPPLHCQGLASSGSAIYVYRFPPLEALLDPQCCTPLLNVAFVYRTR